MLALLDTKSDYNNLKLSAFFKQQITQQNVRNLSDKLITSTNFFSNQVDSSTTNVVSNSTASSQKLMIATPVTFTNIYNLTNHSFINSNKLLSNFMYHLPSEFNSHSSINRDFMTHSALNSYTLQLLGIVECKNIVEFYKSTSNFYSPTSKSLSQLLSNSGKFRAALDPVRYTFELKARFGYNLHKLDLFTPISEEAKTGEKLPIMLLKEYSEYDLKDMNTITRYFMVFDQNRRQALRMYKPAKTTFVNRNSKFDVFNGRTDSTDIQEFKTVAPTNSFCAFPIFTKDGTTEELKGVSPTYATHIVLNTNSFINTHLQYENVLNSLDYDSPKKYNMTTENNVPQTNIRSKKKLLFNQRLLHTTSTLVLPTKLNITVITNSYDVIHSWFIPGLGLKMDCVPGRSTHHTLFIDQPGLYYGQCAEICGRFHHHMPIKVAALQWEHFLLW